MACRRGKYVSTGSAPNPNASTSSPSGPATSVCASSPPRWTRQSPARTLVGHVRLPLPLPREPRPAKDVEDLLLLVLDVEWRGALARVDLDPVQADRLAPRGGAEVGPVGAERPDLGALALEVVPVRDRRHAGKYPRADMHRATSGGFRNRWRVARLATAATEERQSRGGVDGWMGTETRERNRRATEPAPLCSRAGHPRAGSARDDRKTLTPSPATEHGE